MISDLSPQADQEFASATARIAIPVEVLLARYFERVWQCRFEIQGNGMEASEVFHPCGFLPVVAEIAAKRATNIVGEPIPLSIREHDTAYLGRAVSFVQQPDQLVLMMLVRASELMFRPEMGETIELYPIYEFSWLPEAERTRALWQPAAMLEQAVTNARG